MAQIVTKFITDKAVTAIKLGSGAATSTQAAFADGSGGVTYRSIVSGDVPTLNQNTTGTAANITATSNSTLTTLTALATASSLASIGTITTGVWNGTAIDIGHGGTGQNNAASAFNALSPVTTTGDIIYSSSGTTNSRLPIGSTGNVLTVVAGVPAWAPAATNLTVNEENITLSSGDITNQFIDLAHPVQGSSASVNSVSMNVVGGPEQLKTVDYSVSLTGGSGGVTRITFLTALATGGVSALIAGDILQIKYAY